MHFFSCLFFVLFFSSWFLWKSNFLTKHFSGLFPPHYLLTWESRVADFIKVREKVKGDLNASDWNKEEENIEGQVQSYSRTGLSVIKLIFLNSLTAPQFSITDWVEKMVSDSWKSLAFSTYGGEGTKKQIKTKWKKKTKLWYSDEAHIYTENLMESGTCYYWYYRFPPSLGILRGLF